MGFSVGSFVFFGVGVDKVIYFRLLSCFLVCITGILCSMMFYSRACAGAVLKEMS